MSSFLAFTVIGLVTGAGYAIAASGLVVTYTTSRVFNIAHGSVGMLMAFLYWELNTHQGWPVWLSLLVVVGVAAPLLGWLTEKYVMRTLVDAPVSVSLVISVGLLVAWVGTAQWIWPPKGRDVPTFFGESGIKVGHTMVTGQDLITIGVAVVVAGALYVLLNRTRVGIEMRAAVDNRTLVSLHGGKPQLMSSLAWAIGSMLAAVAGILLTPVVQLDYNELTLLVISAYAAAILGRLTSLPLTFLGAVVLGLLQSYAIGYLPTNNLLMGVRAAIPTLFLFAVMLVMPEVRLRVGQIKGILAVPVPQARKAGVWGVVFVVAVAALGLALPGFRVPQLGLALVYALVMLSLVLLTGYGGHVSLGQFSLVGIGAVTVAKLGGGSPWDILAGGLVTAVVGALVALPVLRLTGLYLALSTMAFAQLMDKLVFQSPYLFGLGNTLSAHRVFGLTNDRAYVTLIAVVFVLIALALLAVRRGRIGRVLIAIRDSPAAVGTLGLNQKVVRVAVFAGSSFIAGIAGGLLAGLQGQIQATDFELFVSLPLLLLAVVGGVTSVTGAAIGGFLLMLLPVLTSESPWLGGLLFQLIGSAAVALGRDSNGLASKAFQAAWWVRSRVPSNQSAGRKEPAHVAA